MLFVPFRGQNQRSGVPFMVSQTLVDYPRPSWYVLGCFSLNKIPEISIARTILMIWREPLEHIDQGVYIFEIFQFFAFELILFKGRHQLLPLPHKKDLVTFYNFVGRCVAWSFFQVRTSTYDLETLVNWAKNTAFFISFFEIVLEYKQRIKRLALILSKLGK